MIAANKSVILRVENLKKYFPIRRGIFSRVVNHKRAVDDVSFVVYEQETLGLVGESGCGKTTIGRTILRLYEPTAGRVFFGERNLLEQSGEELRRLRRQMQMVFQDPYGSLNPRMTVRAIVEEPLIIHGTLTPRERLERVCATLAEVGLGQDALNRYPHEFSGGQRQRISLARALVLQPKFLVLDEPLSALDVSIQAKIINLLVDLRAKKQLSYLFISHDLSVVEYLSDRVAVMYLGQIVELAPAREIYSRPLHPYTQALLSAVPSINPGAKRNRIILEGEVPSPINPPPGCRFHPRCWLRRPVCTRLEPRRLNLDGHEVTCHAVEKKFFGTGEYEP
ncbi:MAG: dipeptide ABC transporter ATP-binding protein [Thermoguttaceae bacterium]|nr:dipeptide ABC transporter ATP-binding protein [Thermoguttaceae bacterium]MDW8078707.1 dipeptide ABC transporter ATP-binding protein [Thermoguttaceae bacterium]